MGSLNKNLNANHSNLFRSKHHLVQSIFKKNILLKIKPDINCPLVLTCYDELRKIFRLFFTIMAVIITGIPFSIVMLYQTLSAFFGHMTHANVQMPKKLDKILSLIFITPHFHKIHHHHTLPFTDSNYGNIFSFWDTLFKTSKKFDNLKDITYGIDTHMKEKEVSSLKNLLLIPFKSFKPVQESKFSD